MLTPRLQSAWQSASPADQEEALLFAKNMLRNLTHYNGFKRHMPEDCQMVAAELLWIQSAGEREREDHAKYVTERKQSKSERKQTNRGSGHAT